MVPILEQIGFAPNLYRQPIRLQRNIERIRKVASYEQGFKIQQLGSRHCLDIKNFRALADLPGKDTDGRSTGNKILTDVLWSGFFDINDQASVARLMAYTNYPFRHIKTPQFITDRPKLQTT